MKAKRVLQCALVAVMPLGLLCTCALAGDNAAAIKEFGINESEPIDKGFFFWNYEYVEAPYVVERRGLDIYVNDHLVNSGPEWPPYDCRVDEDPGDPPPGSSPFDETPPGKDSRDDYWSRKIRYLEQHFDEKTANKKMFETYKKCTELTKVTWQGPDTIVVVHKSGRETPIGLEGYIPDGPPPTRADVLPGVENNRAYYEDTLRADGVLVVMEGGGEATLNRIDTLRTLDVLLSDIGDEEKIKALKKAAFLAFANEDARKRIARFRPSARFVRRAKRVMKERGGVEPSKGSKGQRKTPEPSAKALPPEEERARAEQAEWDTRYLRREEARERWKRFTEERDWSKHVASPERNQGKKSGTRKKVSARRAG